MKGAGSNVAHKTESADSAHLGLAGLDQDGAVTEPSLPGLSSLPSFTDAPTPLPERTPTSRSAPGADEELALRAAKGDGAAFDALVVLYTPRVFAVAFRMLKDRAEAEDLAQEVFVTLHHALPKFRHEARLSTWIYRITKNRCLNRIKFLQRRHIGQLADIDDPHVGHALADERSAAGQVLDPSTQLERHQLSKVLEEHLLKLPAEQRLLVVLRDLEDLSYDEIAELTELPIGTVKSRLHRARAALSRSLSPRLARREDGTRGGLL